jgi:hypothetical protein
MVVEDCAQLFSQLKTRIFFKNKNKAPSREERLFIVSACRSWFDYRPKLSLLGAGEIPLIEIDKLMKEMLQSTNTIRRRTFYQDTFRKMAEIFDNIFVNMQVAEWATPNKSSAGDEKVLNALHLFSPDLERRYLQAIADLSDPNRISYAGTANELREIIRLSLSSQAPENEIIKKDWYKQARAGKSRLPDKPTHSEKVKYILETRRAGEQALKSTQENETLIDDMLGKVVRSSYDRVSASVHGNHDRNEIIRALRYIHAFLLDILP